MCLPQYLFFGDNSSDSGRDVNQNNCHLGFVVLRAIYWLLPVISAGIFQSKPVEPHFMATGTINFNAGVNDLIW